MINQAPSNCGHSVPILNGIYFRDKESKKKGKERMFQLIFQRHETGKYEDSLKSFMKWPSSANIGTNIVGSKGISSSWNLAMARGGLGGTLFTGIVSALAKNFQI
ncbi:unnamed protein product [Prunus armeniaca]